MGRENKRGGGDGGSQAEVHKATLAKCYPCFSSLLYGFLSVYIMTVYI